MEPVSLVIKNGRLRYFGHVECKDDVHLLKYWTRKMEHSKKDLLGWYQGEYENFWPVL